MVRAAILLSSLALASGLLARTGQPSHKPHRAVQNVEQYTFHEFVSHFDREYKANSSEWHRREQVFQANLKRLVQLRKAHQAGNKTRTWQPSITMFLDYDDSEYQTLLGYKRTPSSAGSFIGTHRNSTLAEKPGLPKAKVPAEFSTMKPEKKLTSLVRNQGACGSCWAEAAVTCVEGVAETQPEMMAAMKSEMVRLKDDLGILSTQAIVRCTKNTRNCGGSGGCRGATTELGFEMIKERGLPLAAEWPYTASSGKCEEERFKSNLLVTIDSYRVLPKNKLEPLMSALVEKGHPIAVSVDASGWHSYAEGVFSDTDHGAGDFTINHAVVLMAFKNPGYWLIKNSWGTYYGEDGFIRLEFKKDEEAHCGWDWNTHVGIACDGDPDKDWVCGTCGILYDTTYPTLTKRLGKR